MRGGVGIGDVGGEVRAYIHVLFCFFRSLLDSLAMVAVLNFIFLIGRAMICNLHVLYG